MVHIKAILIDIIDNSWKSNLQAIISCFQWECDYWV